MTKKSEAERRIESLIKMEEDRPLLDAAGICDPMNMDAAIRVRAFKQCLEIVRDEAKR